MINEGDFLNIIKAIILGIIQGVTEFLPVSSSGHMSLFTYFSGTNAESTGLFAAMLHIGTLVAIVLTFYRTIYDLFEEFIKICKEIIAREFKFKYKDMSETRKLLFLFIISCVPLLLLLLPVGDGKNLMDVVGVFSSDNSIRAEGICFMFTGFLLLLGSFTAEKSESFEKVNPKSALLIGIAQFFAACFPGISRSGSTISTALMCNVSKKSAVRYSFILSIPAVLASGLVEFKDSITSKEPISVFPLIIGTVVSAIVGLFAIRLLQVIIKKDLFKYFGFYCLGLGFIVTIISAVQTFIK